MWNGKHTVKCKDKTGEQAISDTVVSGVINEFEEICAVPHGSGEEEALAQRINKHFQSFGYKSQIDDAGNVICDIPASDGCENVPLLMLQGHLDMVCAVREGSAFNPHRDPVHLRIDRDEETGRTVLRTDGNSSLGADCGIGDAAVMWAALHTKSLHGPIRIVFTANEEVGLQGAKELDESVLDDVKYLINVDGFGCGRFVAGSAGGRRETYSKWVKRMRLCDAVKKSRRNEEAFVSADAVGDYIAFEVSLSDFHGGHSGYDIDKGRVNAVKLIAGLLDDMRKKGVEYYISSVNGGIKHNVIPSNADAVIVINKAHLHICQQCMSALMKELDADYSEADGDGMFEYHEIKLPEYVISNEYRDAVVDFVCRVFDGVYKHMNELPEVVDTSCNLGQIVCRTKKEVIKDGEKAEVSEDEAAKIDIMLFQRSMSRKFGKELTEARLRAAQKYGFGLEECDEYKPWSFDSGNPLLKLAADSYEDITGKTADISAVHVGLEPSAFAEKNDSICMINMGADVIDPHTVYERVYVDSIKPFALTLKTVIEKIAERNRK